MTVDSLIDALGDLGCHQTDIGMPSVRQIPSACDSAELPLGACCPASSRNLASASRTEHSGAVEGRPINDLERALVSGVLTSAGDGFEALRAQLPTARVVPGCECGCGTIDFVYDEEAVDLPRSTARTQSIRRRA